MKINKINKVLFDLFVFLNIFYNATIANMCISCKSNEKNCSVDPLSITNTVKCDLNHQVCYTKLDNEGRNERGCTKDDDCKKSATCLPCKQIFCNVEIFPTNRPKCYQCRGWDCADNLSEKYEPELCEYYNSSAIIDCFTTNNQFNITRGCFVGSNKNDTECQGFFKKCTKDTCTNSKNEKDKPCNNIPAQLEYKCYYCNSQNDTNCEKEFTDSKFENCLEHNGCYQRTINDIVWRGCTSNLSEDALNKCMDAKDKSCKLCDLPLCNFQKMNGANAITFSSLLITLTFLIINHKTYFKNAFL